MLIFASAEIFASYNIGKVYGSIEKVTHSSGYTTYSASLVTLKTNKINDLSSIKSSEKLGILEDESSIEGYVIPNEVIDGGVVGFGGTRGEHDFVGTRSAHIACQLTAGPFHVLEGNAARRMKRVRVHPMRDVGQPGRQVRRHRFGSRLAQRRRRSPIEIHVIVRNA